MEIDKKLEKYKYLFIAVAAVLLILALMHFYYVDLAINTYDAKFLRDGYSMLCLGAIALSALVGIALLCSDYSFEAICFFAMLMLGIISMRVQPGLSAPDEPVHYVSSYYLSNQLMFLEPADEYGHVYVRAMDRDLEDPEIYGGVLTERTYDEAEYWKYKHEKNTDRAISMQPHQHTTFFVYLPQAIGITIARLLRFDSNLLVTVGKFMNLLFFAFIFALALKQMPFGKEILAACAFLPMTIQLAASFSYDAMLIALSFLFIARVMKIAYGQETVWVEDGEEFIAQTEDCRLTWKDVAILAVIIAIMSPCKMVYMVLLFLVLLIPKERCAVKNMRVYTVLILIVCALIPIIIVNGRTVGTLATQSSNSLTWTEVEGYTVSYCLHHPIKTAALVWDTAMWQGGYYYQTLIGPYTGNMDSSLDTVFVGIALITIIMLMLALKWEESDQTKIKDSSDTVMIPGVRDKLITLIICILIFGLLLGSMLIGWTPMGSPVIAGVQGRYLLPILPLIVLLFRNNLVVIKTDIRPQLLYLLVSCDAFIFIRMYAMICVQA